MKIQALRIIVRPCDFHPLHDAKVQGRTSCAFRRGTKWVDLTGWLSSKSTAADWIDAWKIRQRSGTYEVVHYEDL